MLEQKITQQTIKNLLARGLKENDMVGRVAVIRGLMRIYSLQTDVEKSIKDTTFVNSVGFTAFDGRIMISIAHNFIQYQRLTQKQYNLVAKRIQKYWNQLYKIATGKMKNVPDIEKYMPKTHPLTWVL